MAVTEIYYPVVSGDMGQSIPIESGYSFITGSNSYNIGTLSSWTWEDRAFIRFSSINIPKGATILNAFLRLTPYSTVTGNMAVNVGFNLVADAVAPTSVGTLNSKLVTYNADGYSTTDTWTDGTQEDVESLIWDLQQVVNQEYWRAGNAAMVIFSPKTLSGFYDNLRTISSIDYLAGAEKPELHVTFTPENLTDGASLGDSVEGTEMEYNPSDTDTANMGDAVTAYNMTDRSTDTVNLGDTVTAFNLTDRSTDGALLGDEVTAYNMTSRDHDRAMMGDSGSAQATFNIPTVTDGLVMGDSADALNWTKWLDLYGEIAKRLYYCTLTGAENGTTDITLPMSSFQSRLRPEGENYLSVVVPGDDYALEIAARPDGQLIVSMAYFLSGVEQFRENIAVVDLEDIRLDQGGRSRSITLTGHKAVTYGEATVTLDGETYRSENAGKLIYRTAYPDLYLRPGHTVNASFEEYSDTFTAGMITYIVSVENQSMEVQEAD